MEPSLVGRAFWVLFTLILVCAAQSEPGLEPWMISEPESPLMDPIDIVVPDHPVVQPEDPQCAGVAPILSYSVSGAPSAYASCWRGYWLIPSSVNMSYTGYNIEGRVFVQGNFDLLEGASLAWRGFEASNDSRPDLPLAPNGDLRPYWLSHVNVTGNLTIVAGSSIFVDLPRSEIDVLLGPIDLANPIRSVSQMIAESSNLATEVTLLLNPTLNDNCRQFSVSTSTGTIEANGRFMLSLLIQTDDSGCNPKSKKSNSVVKIVVPCVVIGTLLIVSAVVLAAFKIPSFGKLVLPSRWDTLG
jgi:hypothetical protein